MKYPVRLFVTVSVIVLMATVAFASDPKADAMPVSQQPGSYEGVSDEEITLEKAITIALRQNPKLRSSASGVSAAQAKLDQAGLYANPEFDLELENFWGDDELDGFNGAETTFALSQPLLLGGKIAGRKGVAEADLALANRDLDAARLDITAITTIAFNNVIVAQERVELTEELAKLARSFDKTVKARVEAGKVSPVEGIRTRAAVARAQVDVAKAKRALAAARVSLATTWGSSEPQYGRAVGQLRPPAPLPPRPVLDEMLLQTPEMARLTEELQRQEQVIKLEKARGVPDLTLTAGPRKYQETGSWAWVGGVSLPLPIFNRNQGARRAAEFELERTQHEVTAMRVALEGRLSRTLERLHALGDEVRSYEQEIVPASAEAFDAMSLGFREGKFGFLEVLDAQRSLSEAALLLLDSQQRYAAARAELDRLVGLPLGKGAGDATGAHNSTQGDIQ